MRATELLESQLRGLEAELHSNGQQHIRFNQQDVTKENMSFSGANGRIYIQPAPGGYDISLSGQSLTAEMTSLMRGICGKPSDGYKQTNQRIGKQVQPYWRVHDFSLVREAVALYAKTLR